MGDVDRIRDRWFGPGFTVAPLPTRIIFGAGARTGTAAALAAAGIGRPLVLCTPRGRTVADEVTAGLRQRVAGVFDRARMHVPRSTVDEALGEVRRLRPDGCLAVGGGSTIGLAKALALGAGLPYVAVPTTYAGSEMTPVWGTTDGGLKTTGRDERVRPVTAIYDPDLTLSLPPGTSIASGLNAIAHAAEALYAPDGSPYVDTLATDGAARLTAALGRLLDDPRDPGARADALYGAALCGICLGGTAMSLHHKLCHVLGGSFDLPHAQTHAAVLPYVLAVNLPAAPAADAALRYATGEREPELALWRLHARGPAAASLRDLGLRRADIPRAVELTMRSLGTPQANPRPVGAGDLTALLTAASVGEQPRRADPP